MHKTFPVSELLISLVLLLTMILPALGQDVEFESLLLQRQVTCILEFGDQVLGGLDGGGILTWNREDPSIVHRLSAGDDLSGNNVSAMAWTGRHIWVATKGGGMTRITNLATDPEYRKYASNLGSLDITAVNGEVLNGIELVYYGMNNGGIGVITDGSSGAIYTAENDGLISNSVNDLQIFSGDLFVATPLGVSRFANNIFTDQNNGLTNTAVNELALDQGGNLIAGTGAGIFRWESDSETWETLGWTGGEVVGLSSNDTQLWALGVAANGISDVGYFDGSSWSRVTLPQPRAYALDAGQDVWVGGRSVAPGMNSGKTGLAWYGAFDGEGAFSDHAVEASLVLDAWGLTIDSEGRTWIGSNGGDSVSGILEEQITNIYELASVANDSSGLINHWSNIQSLASDSSGLVYIGQYGGGIVRRDNNTGEIDLMTRQTCGLPVGPSSLVNLTVHPDGTLIVMYDWATSQKVAILTDPEHWRGDANWYNVPQGSEGLGETSGVWDALVERNDVVWFAAEGLGLMRWDINGYSAGPDDEITWSDFTDDRWAGPISRVTGTTNDPKLTKGLALAPDGTIWYGGNGITRFSYDENFGTVEKQEAYGEKTVGSGPGLISGNVSDLAVDANGDLWVSTRSGLNCVRWGTSEVKIDAYMDQENYFSNNTYFTLYSTSVIRNLPAGSYNRVVSSADGTRLALATSRGAVAWDTVARSAEEKDNLSSLYFYPNPWTIDGDDSLLKLGGITADDGEDDPAKVEIYTIEGQLVFRNSHVSAGEPGFWNGQNRVGNAVASGMYLMKASWRGMTTIRTLALVR
jgi:ligand-binding sensor domain-containing protein